MNKKTATYQLTPAALNKWIGGAFEAGSFFVAFFMGNGESSECNKTAFVYKSIPKPTKTFPTQNKHPNQQPKIHNNTNTPTPHQQIISIQT
jgi:hypothetical protein